MADIFMKELWSKWFEEEYYQMVNRKPYYFEKEHQMKIFHYNDPNISIPSKCGEYHDSITKKWWGHIYTNKYKRSNDRYAWFFSPDGTRANRLNKSSFCLLSDLNLEHVYPITVTERELNGFIDKIPALTQFQAHRLFNNLVDKSQYFEIGIGLESSRYKRGSWVNIFRKED